MNRLCVGPWPRRLGRLFRKSRIKKAVPQVDPVVLCCLHEGNRTRERAIVPTGVVWWQTKQVKVKREEFSPSGAVRVLALSKRHAPSRSRCPGGRAVAVAPCSGDDYG